MSLTDVAIFDLITCIDQRKFDKQSPECPGSLPYFQGNGRLGPLGVHLWVSQRDVSGAKGSLVSRFINEKPDEVTWLLVSISGSHLTAIVMRDWRTGSEFYRGSGTTPGKLAQSKPSAASHSCFLPERSFRTGFMGWRVTYSSKLD